MGLSLQTTDLSLLEIALADHRAGSTEIAGAVYRELLERTPGIADLHHLLALALAPSDPAASESELRRAISLEPDTALFHQNALRLCPVADRAEFERRIVRALATNPANAFAQWHWGALLSRAGDFTRAARSYRRALASDPSTPSLLFDIGITELHLKAREDARRRYARLRAATPFGDTWDPSNLEFWATAEIGSGYWRDAAARYKAAVATRAIGVFEAGAQLLLICAMLQDDEALIGMADEIIEATFDANADPRPLFGLILSIVYDMLPIRSSWKVLDHIKKVTPLITELQKSLGSMLLLYGDVDGAREAFGKSAAANEAKVSRRLHQYRTDDVRVVGPGWLTRSLGEMAVHLSCLAKLKRLGLIKPWKLVLPAPRSHIVNEPFLNLFQDDLLIVKDSPALDEYEALAEDLGLDSNAPPLNDGRFPFIYDSWQMAEIEWRRKRGGRLLTVKPEMTARGRTVLSELGIGAHEWIVGLHVRDSGYHRETTNLRNKRDHAARNADLATYLPAIECIVKRGGRVIRFGTNAATPIPTVPGLVDYARSSWRSQEFDVALWSLCRFFIGTVSGVTNVVTCLGVPVLLTNWTFAPLLLGADDIWIPKRLRHRDTGRVLPLRELLSHPFRGNLRSFAFDELGYDVIDNSSDDILSATDEMINRLEGRKSSTVAGAAVASIFEELRAPYLAPLADSYLQRHQKSLLGQ